MHPCQSAGLLEITALSPELCEAAGAGSALCRVAANSSSHLPHRFTAPALPAGFPYDSGDPPWPSCFCFAPIIADFCPKLLLLLLLLLLYGQSCIIPSTSSAEPERIQPRTRFALLCSALLFLPYHQPSPKDTTLDSFFLKPLDCAGH